MYLFNCSNNVFRRNTANVAWPH
ncbi:hypothetical protein [Novosphingopyxis iocasae]